MAVFEMVIVSVVAAVGFIFLLINLVSLKQTREYLANKAQEPVAPSGNKPQPKEKTELLHRLLEEGKITIEEYDRLMGE